MNSESSQTLEMVVSGPKDNRLRKAFEHKLRRKRVKGIKTEGIEREPKWVTSQTSPVDLFVVLCPRESSAVRSVAECLKSLSLRPCRTWAGRILAKLWDHKRRYPAKRVGIWLSTSAGHSVPIKLEPDDVVEAIFRSVDRKTSAPQTSVKEEEWAMLSVAAYCGGRGVDEFNKKISQGMPHSKAALEVINNSNPSEDFEKAKFAF